MESLSLPKWTLSARLDGNVLEFSLSDGRRLALRARRQTELLRRAILPPTATELFGAELAGRLVSSEPRPLNVLYECTGVLNGVDWEHVSLGAASMAEHFALGRQLLSDADVSPAPATSLAETLAAWVVHGGIARACPRAQRFAFDAIDQGRANEAVASADVLVLDGV